MDRLNAAWHRALDLLNATLAHLPSIDLSTALPTFTQWLILAALWLAAALYSYWFRHHRLFNLSLLPLWLAWAVWELLWAGLPGGLTVEITDAARTWLPLDVLLLAIVPALAVPSWRLLLLVGVLAAQLAGPVHGWGLADLVRDLALRVNQADVLPGGLVVEQALFGLATLIALVRWRWQRDVGHLAAAGIFVALYWFWKFPFWSLLAANAVLLLAAIYSSHRMAFFDRLTGIPNRRALDLALADTGKRFALAMIDIDHFKKINDRHGHDFGDEVLRAVAGAISRLRGCKLFRYGGEEFCVLIQGRRAGKAEVLCERIRETVAGLSVVPRGSDRPTRKPKNPARRPNPAGVPVTVSIGLAWADEHDGDPQAVLTTADAALYKAKRQGRNRVVFSA